MGKFTHEQQIALAVVPKISTVLSIVGSGWVTAEVLRDERKLEGIYHRLMLTMSLGDIFRSAAQFLTTWPMPADTPGVYGAAGSTATCTAQGFFFQAGLPFILYNAYLALYFVMVLRWNWPNWRIRRYEPWALRITVALSACTSLAGLPLELYNAANLWCWIAPLNCAESQNKSCERGENAWIYRYAFWYVWLWSTIAVNTICMVVIFFTVRTQERRTSRTQGMDSDMRRKLTRCRKVVAGQAIYYTVTFFMQTAFNTATRVIQQQTGKVYFPLVLLMAFFAPLNGFWNGLIYLRPRLLSLKEMHPDWRLMLVIRQALSRIMKGRNGDSDDDHELGVISNSLYTNSTPENGEQSGSSPRHSVLSMLQDREND
mmetsp:Transcript_50215/g.92857  ORF Transcript_50215/g.92857 Transcript_50215/m.92857 type:complete len:372 (-) Transcript_50215:456-1571(-)|eukprot:CAMPEP_0197439590 /NCGR_PEP_ID=MMETSP1175-20131217/6298_1 /TAXON_ID=1003142 /ORGANISM="Triceratium dubium, Strain CCMP147" /LENGTH=371 /DNA_ID=CAMNT_0042969525 /DNA_START=199 /DNA_END=1314 /DNA_ORIENTATION=+